jgi:hypothetical protein
MSTQIKNGKLYVGSYGIDSQKVSVYNGNGQVRYILPDTNPNDGDVMLFAGNGSSVFAPNGISGNPIATLYGPSNVLNVQNPGGVINFDYKPIPNTINQGFIVSNLDPFTITFEQAGTYNITHSLVLSGNNGGNSSANIIIYNGAGQPITFGSLGITDYVFGGSQVYTEITRQTNIDVAQGFVIRFAISASVGNEFSVPINLSRLLIQKL